MQYIIVSASHDLTKIEIDFVIPINNKVESNIENSFHDTVMIQSFRTDWSRQIVQTEIRLLLREQSDQGIHCLLFHLQLFDEIPLD